MDAMRPPPGILGIGWQRSPALTSYFFPTFLPCSTLLHVLLDAGPRIDVFVTHNYVFNICLLHLTLNSLKAGSLSVLITVVSPLPSSSLPQNTYLINASWMKEWMNCLSRQALPLHPTSIPSPTHSQLLALPWICNALCLFLVLLSTFPEIVLLHPVFLMRILTLYTLPKKPYHVHHHLQIEGSSYLQAGPQSLLSLVQIQISNYQLDVSIQVFPQHLKLNIRNTEFIICTPIPFLGPLVQ